MSKMHEAAKLGQAIWIDFIRRSFLESGEMQALVDQGLRGMTSNPTIFDKAITGSDDYDEDLQRLVKEGKSVDEIYETLAIEDIRRAADMLRPVYDATGGVDGYVSLEVSPTLAHDTRGTITDAKRLFKAVDRPNLMIKVPATPEGIPAIEALIGEGINVNVTLIFSLSHYEATAEAYIGGLETLLKRGGDLNKIASVASFFVSRVDTAVDAALEAAGNNTLQGKIAVANARVAYARFLEIFSGARWNHLVSYGARAQRPLWASTSIKNPNYPDLLYVDNLIGPNTVNTVPPDTLKAFMDHSEVECGICTIEEAVEEARDYMDELAALGIDLDAITEKLQKDGVESFAKSFDGLMGGIAQRRQDLLAGWEHQSASLGAYQAAVDAALDRLHEEHIVGRIWQLDHTVWKPEPDEIANRLGWLLAPEFYLEKVYHLNALVESVREDGYTNVLLLGMGGSSLAPEVFRKTFGVADGCLDLAVLDSTDPGAVLAQANRLDLAKTLFVVSTKSGGTAETLSFFKFFYKHVVESLGKGHAGAHFVAVTDAGSKLDKLAKELDFRAIFHNDPNVGGRYSAFTYFGLVPAALIGADIENLLDHAEAAAHSCAPTWPLHVRHNPGAWLGAIISELAKAGRDKLTFIVSPPLASFGDWVEQLIAESTGKAGKGILPVVGEPLGAPGVYSSDRLFVYIQLEGDDTHTAGIDALEQAGYPVVRMAVSDRYALARLMYLWEMATAIAGHCMDINPFDQPNVEAAKVLAREMIAAYIEAGELPAETAAITDGDITVYGETTAGTAGEALRAFAQQAEAGANYIALQAYVQPTPEAGQAFEALRARLRDSLKAATTFGYGPRFLHSTGQLHKGDAGSGLFIQFTADNAEDAPIPDEFGAEEATLTFGVLISAQALGDAAALRDADPPRKVIRFHLGGDVVAGIKRLAAAL
jgi:transaldolase/glucose-6-phosphate isomerase